MSTVTGKVTINGQPAPEKTIVRFSPLDPALWEASGMVDASGNYTLYSGNEGKPGAMPGKYKVYLTPDASGTSYMEGPASPGDPTKAQDTGGIPKQYTNRETSDKEVEVTAGANAIDIEL